MCDDSPAPIVLEPAAQQVADTFSKPPFLYEMAPPAARKVLDDMQAPVNKLPVDEEWITVPAPVGDVRVRIIKPQGPTGMLPVIVYMHGGGWVLGNAGTHDRLVRELAVGAQAALAFVEYPNSPEAHYPTAIEQGYATAQWITRDGRSQGPGRQPHGSGRRIGRRQHDGRAGTDGQGTRRRHLRAAVDVLPGHRRGDEHRLLRPVRHRLLPHPHGRWSGSGTPTPPTRPSAPRSRHRRTRPASKQVTGLPPTYLCVDEADVLRDEGEAYAAKLRAAGVPVTTVRYDGTIHDFMLLNSLSETRATRAAIDQATMFLRSALGTG